MRPRSLCLVLLALALLAGRPLAAQSRETTLFAKIGAIYFKVVDETATRAFPVSSDALLSRIRETLAKAGVPTRTASEWEAASQPPFLQFRFSVQGTPQDAKVAIVSDLDLRERISIWRDGKWQEQLITVTSWNNGRIALNAPAAVAIQLERDLDALVALFVTAYRAGRGN